MLSSIVTDDRRVLAPTSPLLDPAKFETSWHLPNSLRLDRPMVRRLANKEHVFCEGDPRTSVFQIEEGVVTLYRMLADGRRQIVDFVHPGEFVGLGATPEHFFSAEAAGPVRVRVFSACALEDAAAHEPSLALQLYKAVSLELSAARSLLVAIGQRSALERVAAFLLMLSRRGDAVSGNGRVIHLAMRRSDIGDLLGLTIETVSRMMTKLRMMRVITVTNGTEIRIADAERLEEISEGELTE